MALIRLVSILAVLITFGLHDLLAAAEPRARVIVLTDVSNEPDDEESLVRLLVYSNEYDVEGLIATTSTWLREKPREDLIRRDIEAYSLVRVNLLKHAPGFPEPDQLRAVTATGQPGYGLSSVGLGKRTAGSKRIIEAIDKADDRPLWISVWGGANTLAQALWDLKASRSDEEVKRAIGRLRVYTISDQDDAGAWIRREFPDLFYIVSPSTQDAKEYHRATWNGISGDRFYKGRPGPHFDLVDNPWLEQNVINNHGPLGALYPRLKYIMEGDTPSFLGLINNGLGWAVSPAYGGWGGRYALYRASGETRPIWTNNADSRDTVAEDCGKTETSDQATVWRWREHFQHDFAARMDWCVADDFSKANHNPVVALNGDRTRDLVTIQAKGGSTVALSGEGTRDPDGDRMKLTWWIYAEAGTPNLAATLSATEGSSTEVRLPQVQQPGELHVMLQAEDDGNPSLFAYRRVIIAVLPRQVTTDH